MEKIYTTPMDRDWLNLCRVRGWTFDTVYADGFYEDLKTKLLEVGGEAVSLVVNWKKFCPKILSDEAKFFTEISQETAQGKEFVGYALREDGIWVYAEWVVKDEKAYNAKLPYLAFYGAFKA